MRTLGMLWDLFSDRYWGIVVHGAFLKIDRAQVYQTGWSTAAGGYWDLGVFGQQKRLKPLRDKGLTSIDDFP